ncbi:MAG: hypothetical protein IPI35_29710 [Deltaproteobacteria bacterium]|nr:hypothetical protein [Deltaproteobacteria bacterium]
MPPKSPTSTPARRRFADGVVNDCDADGDTAAALAQCSVMTPDDACVTIDGFNAPIAHSVNVAGDINGDGHADLYVITAAPDSEGVMWPNTAHFLLGPFTRGETVTLADAVWRVSVPSADQRLYVSPAADLLDDDGRDELFFMVHDNNYCLDGDCSVYFLGLNDRPPGSLDTRAAQARLSFTAQGNLTATGSVPVDYDGDGVHDVLLGQATHADAWNYDRFFLFSGPQEGQALTTADAKLVFTPPQSHSGLGTKAGP